MNVKNRVVWKYLLLGKKGKHKIYTIKNKSTKFYTKKKKFQIRYFRIVTLGYDMSTTLTD